jgi:hypothetical protein
VVASYPVLKTTLAISLRNTNRLVLSFRHSLCDKVNPSSCSESFSSNLGKTFRQDQLLLGRCLLCNLRSCSLHGFSLANLPKIALVGPCEGLHWLDHEEPKFSKVSMSPSSAIELDEAVLQPAATNMLLCRLSLEVTSIVSAIDLFSPRICIDLSSFAKLHTDMFEHSIPRPRVTSTSTARVEALVLGRLSSCLTSLATDSVYNESIHLGLESYRSPPFRLPNVVLHNN